MSTQGPSPAQAGHKTETRSLSHSMLGRTGLLPLVGGSVATQCLLQQLSQFCFQAVYSLCSFSYLLISHRLLQLLQGKGQAVLQGLPVSAHLVPACHPAAAHGGNTQTTDGFGCPAPVLLSVGKKISGNAKSGNLICLNASSDGESVPAWPGDLACGCSPALGISKGPNCSSLQLERPFKVTFAIS